MNQPLDISSNLSFHLWVFLVSYIQPPSLPLLQPFQLPFPSSFYHHPIVVSPSFPSYPFLWQASSIDSYSISSLHHLRRYLHQLAVLPRQRQEEQLQFLLSFYCVLAAFQMPLFLHYLNVVFSLLLLFKFSLLSPKGKTIVKQKQTTYRWVPLERI